MHRRPGNLLSNREGDRTGASAEVDHQDVAAVGDHRTGRVHRDLPDLPGLRSWDEHARADDELETAERRDPGQVLHRDAPCPCGHEVRETGRCRSAEDDRGLELTAAHRLPALLREGEGREELGIDHRRADAGRGQSSGRLPERVSQGGCVAHASCTASWAASSASIADLTTGSRSPSRTASRLYALYPVRWSAIRFSG
ncbi:hypothetical protein GALL_402400 [mine drainage metagenome]|uniref:Uncharacterized protein n=1 Tax=mine drainage metagenome TaxID=410659 RepID=A0A1J5Q415_9ZZZZ